MAGAGHSWLAFSVGLETVSNLWEVKLQDTQLQTLFRLVLYFMREHYKNTVYVPIRVRLLSWYIVMSGTSACEYILGNTSVRGVPEVIKENIHIASQYVAHVYCCRCNPHGIIRTSEMSKKTM